MAPEAIDVLLVEDDPADVDLTKESLKESKVTVNLHVVNDGLKALQYLRREASYAGAARPDVVLLDLNLPKKDGREVLRDIKQDEDLKRIPVVILTTSDTETDILKSYDLGANCYITKPVGLDQFSKVVRAIEEFWFSVVKLPHWPEKEGGERW